eukprot:TRINITY_DN798_c0_g1_i1.p1 TRINITY_DN798_c0_g1~~TRINITY_DN798_c0_g1_i1.p1  ORF type:complete len:620 (-),score=68.39 TRINITY_DN798_c0_g1_i1:189-2048(-)
MTWPRGASHAFGAKLRTKRNPTHIRHDRVPPVWFASLAALRRSAITHVPSRLCASSALSNPSAPCTPSITVAMATTGVEWNRKSLTRLLRALVLSRGSLTLTAALLPDMSTGSIRNALHRVSLAHGNPSSWSHSKHTTFVLHRVANHNVPPAVPPPPMPPSSTASKRVALQLVPATTRDAELVCAGKHYPFLEIKLRSRRPLWDVYAHVFTKWGLPIRLLTLDHLSIHTPVASILPPTSELVRLQYFVINVPVDFSALSCIIPSDQQPKPTANQPLSTDAEDHFWTQNTTSHLPTFDFASDSLFNVSSTQPDSYTPSIDLCTPLMKNRRVVAPLSLEPHLHPQKKKPSRPRTRPVLPQSKSIMPLPSARPTIQKTQKTGEKAVLNRLRSHLEQLSSKPSESTAMPHECTPVPVNAVDVDCNKSNFSPFAASDSIPEIAQSPSLKQPSISNGANSQPGGCAARLALPSEKSIVPLLPSARHTIQKVQSRGETSVLKRLRCHLEQLSSPKSSEAAETSNRDTSAPAASTFDTGTNNPNLPFFGASDSNFSLGLSMPVQQATISNGATDVQIVHGAIDLIVRDELAVDLNHGTHFDASEEGRVPALAAHDASLNFSALFHDL